MGSTKLKIAYFHQDGLITGSAISLRHFLNALDRDLFEPIVILAKDGPVRNLYEEMGVKVEVFYFDTFWTFPGPRCMSRGMIKQMRALIPNKKLKEYIVENIKPDIIHINDKASLNVGISLKKSGIPIIQHSRSSYHITACLAAKLLSIWEIRRFSSHIICISEDEVDGFEDIENKSIIYNTVDFDLVSKSKNNRYQTRKDLGVNSDEFLIGFAANVTEKKGAWDFLEICKCLSLHSSVKFIIVGNLDDEGKTHLGDGVYVNQSAKSYLTSFLENNKLENQVILTGFRSDNLDLIAAMDLLIVPNKNGVLGRQPIEAQALGTRVIAYHGHSQKSKVILNNKTGFLVKDVKEAVDKALDIIKNSSISVMANEGEEYARMQFNPFVNIKKIEKLYTKLISK